MNPANVKSTMYIDFDKRNHKEDTKFEVDDHARVSKYKDIFANISNWSEELFVIIGLKMLFRGHMLLVMLTVKKFLEGFTKKSCKKSLELEK